MTKPITPDEVAGLKVSIIPPKVFEIFNHFIAKHWNGNSSTFEQKDIVADLASKLGISRDEVFLQHFLDVEDCYRQAGWKVKYDKPGFNESYAPTFTFSK